MIEQLKAELSQCETLDCGLIHERVVREANTLPPQLSGAHDETRYQRVQLYH